MSNEASTRLLSGLTAIVTGGNAGIGKAIASLFAQQGARVAIFATNVERGQETVEEISSLWGEKSATFYQVDVSQFSQTEESVKKVIEDFGRVDILVNNAGITKDNLLMKMSEEDWDRVLDVNLKSVFNVCKALIRSFLKAKSGKIINISSVVGLTGNAGQINYASSKSGMIGFTKSLAQEVASRGICVNCIAPGFIETSMTQALSESQREGLLKQIPMAYLGKPEDIAQAALFLASSMSRYITGQVLTVDGGMVM